MIPTSENLTVKILDFIFLKNVYFPFLVNRALDKLKDTDEEGSKVARMASRWLENASYKGSSVRILREHEKSKINITYPVVQTRETW